MAEQNPGLASCSASILLAFPAETPIPPLLDAIATARQVSRCYLAIRDRSVILINGLAAVRVLYRTRRAVPVLRTFRHRPSGGILDGARPTGPSTPHSTRWSGDRNALVLVSHQGTTIRSATTLALQHGLLFGFTLVWATHRCAGIARAVRRGHRAPCLVPAPRSTRHTGPAASSSAGAGGCAPAHALTTDGIAAWRTTPLRRSGCRSHGQPQQRGAADECQGAQCWLPQWFGGHCFDLVSVHQVPREGRLPTHMNLIYP